MLTALADLAANARAGGTGAPLLAGAPLLVGSAPAAPATDEAAMMSIIRLINQVGGRPLSPVDRAFLMGARAMFAELVTVCDTLLKPPAAPVGAGGLVGAAPAPTPRPVPGSRSLRGGRKPPGPLPQ